MLEAIKARNNQLGIDQALFYAVTMGWEDLAANNPRSMNVEYVFDPGKAIDHLRIWAVRDRGYQDLLCSYSTVASQAEQNGARFGNGRFSARLSETLDFIMENQALFTRPADACRNGFVQIRPPSPDDQARALAWTRSLGGLETEPSKTSDDHG
jgi:hypothetical protein